MTDRLQRSTRRGLAVASALLGFLALPCGAADALPSAVFAPIDLEVIDVDATVAIAHNAGERLPLVVVHDPSVAIEVAEGFDQVFAATRGAFAARLQAAFGVAALDSAAFGEQAFRDFRSDFQDHNTLFPVSPGLAQTWARGFDGEPVRERISGLLLAFERDQLIGAVRPASSIFVVAPGAGDGARSWGEVAPRARAVEASAVLTTVAAGELLRRMNDPLDRAAGGYLSGLLRANVSEDRHLTGLLLGDRLGGAVVERTIAKGTQLTEAGRPVDAWAALALEQLAWRGIRPLDAPPVQVANVDGKSDAAEPEEAPSSVWLWWFAGAGVLFVGGAALALGIYGMRRRTSGTLVAASEAGATGSVAGEAMIPHLARELKDRLVRALFTQRSVLLANEQAASRRVQEMEERLARLQPAIAERIRGYEQRIEALEKEIAERDVETRDLLRAKLVLARKELDAEISRNRIDWN